MHPFGIYLAITDQQREHGGHAGDRPTTFAAVDAEPLTVPERRSRLAALASSIRRRMPRTVRAVAPTPRAGR